jgi:hypothetical protein
VKDAVKEWLNELTAEVYDEDTKTRHTLWQVPDCWWRLCIKNLVSVIMILWHVKSLTAFYSNVIVHVM